MKYRHHVDVIRYDEREKLLYIQGWLFFTDGRDYKMKIMVDGKKVPYVREPQERKEVLDIWKEARRSEQVGYNITVKTEQCPKTVEVWVKGGDVIKCLARRNERSIPVEKNASSIRYCLDSKRMRDNKIVIHGWAISYLNEEVGIHVYDVGKREVPIRLRRTARLDVLERFSTQGATTKCGFELEITEKAKPAYRLVFTDSESRVAVDLVANRIKLEQQVMDLMAVRFLKEVKKSGFRRAAIKAYNKLTQKENQSYQKWFDAHKATPEQLAEQRKTVFAYQPKFSIAVPLFRTPEKYLKEMIQSVIDQSYGNWELCLADGGGKENSVQAIVEEFSAKDSRVRYKLLEENFGIAGNTNAALEMAQGDFLALLDHDDILAPDALFECVKLLNEDPETDIIYTDEDKVDMEGKSHFDPHFKPDFNLDLLHTQNYICHFFVAKKSVVDQTDGFRPMYDGAQDFDFIFRCTEVAKHIRHIPKILYYWRCHMNSTAMNPESKLYAYEAGVRAIEDHYKRLGIPAKVENGVGWGLYHTIYQYKEKPLISIIIPNKDHISDLNRCMRSIVKKTKYPNIEFIIVENNSTEKKTFGYYDLVEGHYPFVHVVKWEGPFNYSAINNYGVTFAKGEYLLFLNNDTQMINDDCLEEMLGPCMRDDVGCVGAKLLFSDNTIQHAGVILGLGAARTAGHAFYGLPNSEYGYMLRQLAPQDYSAVTAACMMVKKSVFEEVGGFSEELAVAFNDVDFCLKLRKAGYLVYYNPYAMMYHYESKTRGMEDDPVKKARFDKECAIFKERWNDILEKGDPYYNPNFTLDKSDFSLRD